MAPGSAPFEVCELQVLVEGQAAATAAPPASEGSSGGGLSAGAIAGIAVGSTVALLAAGLLVWRLGSRRCGAATQPADSSRGLSPKASKSQLDESLAAMESGGSDDSQGALGSGGAANAGQLAALPASAAAAAGAEAGSTPSASMRAEPQTPQAQAEGVQLSALNASTPFVAMAQLSLGSGSAFGSGSAYNASAERSALSSLPPDFADGERWPLGRAAFGALQRPARPGPALIKIGWPLPTPLDSAAVSPDDIRLQELLGEGSFAEVGGGWGDGAAHRLDAGWSCSARRALGLCP